MEQNNMKIKININGEYIPATLEVLDGVMIVSPKEEKVDVSQFITGDIITCGWDEKDKSCSWVSILDGRIEEYDGRYFIEEFCNMYLDERNNPLCTEHDSSDAATWVRYATEEEKQKLIDALAKEGKAWDAEKKAVVELKWKPRIGDVYYSPLYTNNKVFSPCCYSWNNSSFDTNLQNRDWVFRTEEECEAFCKRLNKAVSNIKP